jgi:hypothetical protein
MFISRFWVTPRSLLRNAEVNTSMLLVATQQLKNECLLLVARQQPAQQLIRAVTVAMQ